MRIESLCPGPDNAGDTLVGFMADTRLIEDPEERYAQPHGAGNDLSWIAVPLVMKAGEDGGRIGHAAP